MATNETIPSTCDTCHTFPQIGPAVASLPLGEPPTTHNDDSCGSSTTRTSPRAWIPGGQSCGECHARDYCVNCHSTGAVTVDHDEMATNHAAVIREQGNDGLRLLPPAGVLRHVPRQQAGAARDDAVLLASGTPSTTQPSEPPAGLPFPRRRPGDRRHLYPLQAAPAADAASPLTPQPAGCRVATHGWARPTAALGAAEPGRGPIAPAPGVCARDAGPAGRVVAASRHGRGVRRTHRGAVRGGRAGVCRG